MLRDLSSNLEVHRAISPTRVIDNTPQVSQVIDLANRGSCLFAIAAGTLADADATFTATVHHGDQANLSDAAVVPADYLVGSAAGASFGFADDDQTRKVGYIGPKRYVRLTITPANNAGNADLGAAALLGSPVRKLPAA